MRSDPNDPSSIRFTGSITPYSSDVKSPYDIPGISADEAALLVQQMEGTDTASGALTSDIPSDAGCNASGGQWLGTIALILLSFRRFRRVALASTLCALSLVGATEVTSHAQSPRCGYGTLVFWDGRTNGDGANQAGETNYVSHPHLVGWTLNPTSTTMTNWNTCAPTVINCGFSPVREARLTLMRSTGGGPFVALPDGPWGTTVNGNFSICDNVPPLTTPTYMLRVNYRSRDSYPTLFEVEPSVGGPAFWTDIPISIYVGGTPLGQISINTAGDTVSTGFDVSNLYAVMFDTIARIESEGETRIRKRFSSSVGTKNIIEARVAGGMGATFSQDLMSVGSAWTHGFSAAHELGHILLLRVLNRALIIANPMNIAPQRPHSAEGVNLNEAFPVFMQRLYMYNPNTASTSDIHTHSGAACEAEFTPTMNRAGEFMNNANALWELMDHETHTFNARTDSSVVSLPQLMDAMVAWSAITTGANRSINEGHSTLIETARTCTQFPNPSLGVHCLDNTTTPPTPLWGQVCNQVGSLGRCISGDVHGANLRDLIHYLPGGTTSTPYLDTLLSAPCLGSVDNTGALGGNGGFRDD